MKKLIALFVLLSLLVGVTVSVRADEPSSDITVVEEVTETSAPDALCKSGSHRFSFQQSGVEKAWVKFTVTNACWSPCGISMENSTRSKGANSGWTVTWAGSSLGGRSCNFNTFKKWSDANVNSPGVTDYITHQESWLKFSEPQDLNLSWWKTPVVFP